MPTIKIYPPAQLPDRGVTETQFAIWIEELEVYLSQEEDLAQFLHTGNYPNWQSKEVYENRIAELVEADQSDAETPEAQQRENTAKLANVRTKLRTVLALVGKCVSEGHYNTVIRHSTSLEWIYNTLRSDFDIQKKGIHFFNILNLKYDAEKTTPISFYNQYRTLIINNLSKNGDVIKYKNDLVLREDEKMSPMLEDLVLLNVLREIDPRLPAFVKVHYNHKMQENDKIMDFKSDMMNNIGSFLEQLDSSEQNLSMKEAASLNAFRPQQQQQKQQPNTRIRNSRKPTARQRKGYYCRMCWLEGLPRDVFTSHSFGDPSCTSISHQDRLKLNEGSKFSNIKESEEPAVDEDELAEMHGYSGHTVELGAGVEVKSNSNHDLNSKSLSRMNNAEMKYIQPVPSQILTVFRENDNKNPVHIDLDSGATLNYCLESAVLKNGFKIFPNGQLSRLGDGVTKLKATGEIHVSFFRNKREIKYNAVVCKTLTSPFIGGTLFMKENGVEQDFVRNVIYLNDRKVTVQPTDQVALLPTAPIVAPIKVTPPHSSSLLKFNRRTLLPGQSQVVSVKQEDGEVVSVEPWEQNEDPEWPRPELHTIKNGTITLHNSSNKAILLGTKVKQFKIRNTTEDVSTDPEYYKYVCKLSNLKSDGSENISLIEHNRSISDEANKIIDDGHVKFSSVFNKDLTRGYNGYYGTHQCHLNWATSERPPATKVRVPSYDHDLKGLQQELMDDLTDQGVLMIPQDHNIKVQSVCPSFIQRKQRAKNKPKQDLTKEDVRLLINFGPINDKIKPPPIHVPKTEDILIKLGRWKYIIIFDLLSGYFQNHMSPDSIPWLGVQTPFGGLRVISRSGQGLMGMGEEFDELLAKVLKEELKEGICDKIVDDVAVGGDTPIEAAINYVRVLGKLNNANLKISPEKTKIFPKSADVLGWVWEEGGYLKASPHRQLGLLNTKIDDIKTVRDMRSWVGLFKTLHIVTPRISEILAPFEASTAGKDTKDKFEWNFELEKLFRNAKEQISKQVRLVLPSPDEQLIMETDAAKGGGKDNLPAGIGHVVFVVRDGKKLPVRVHSAKLPDKCKKWSPCEVEALAFAAGIDREYDLVRESKHPLIICPDSKPVHEAVKFINQGKFSASARMSSFLTNVNRTRIESKHISGKAKLNPISDLQSRYPADCNSDHCSIHKFLNEAIDSVVDEGAKNCQIKNEANYNNKTSWKSAQEANQACVISKQLLTSGKPPPKAIGKTSGEFYNDIRQYCRDATVTKDGLLVVKAKPDLLSGNIPRERIIIPKPLVPALLYHLHNHNDAHPVRSQQKASFQRQFYAIHIDKHLDLLYKNCYKCAALQKLPRQIIQNETKTDVTGPQTHFHADVIKRATQNILTLKDHFSSFQDALIIPSEKASDLKEGLIALSSALRRPAEVYISVDNSPGFKSLLLNDDKDLLQLNIKLVKTEEINKNANAVIDKGCQELEEEIKRLDPEGNKLSLATLKLAVMNLNSKLRRRGNISSWEINTARDQNTGNNLNLDDNNIRDDQLKTRIDKRIPSKVENIKVGDTVRIRNKTNKHKANDMYIVTAEDEDSGKVGVQKLLHSLEKNVEGKITSKILKTSKKLLTTIHKPEFPHDETDEENEEDVDEEYSSNEPEAKPWSPINSKFYDESSEDEDEEYIAKRNQQQHDDDNESNQNDADDENSQVSDEANINNDQLQWDSSPEQLELQPDDDLLQVALQPRQLFVERGETDRDEEDVLTQDTSDDEVFIVDQFKTPPSAPRENKLKRQNAMRKPRKHQATSEPRVTRTMLQSNRYQSVSNPTSPSDVNLNRVQNLESILQPRVPIVPAAVNMEHGAVQVLDEAYENETKRRHSKRNENKRIDYKKFNKYGKD